MELDEPLGKNDGAVAGTRFVWLVPHLVSRLYIKVLQQVSPVVSDKVETSVLKSCAFIS